MFLEIITPDKKVFEGEVDSVQMPGIMGSFEVLNNHAAIISPLADGKVKIKSKESKEIMIYGGVVEVLKNKVVILAESVA